MKYALIGCGRISPNHIEAARNNNLDFVAMCDVLPEAMQEKSDRFGLESVRRYTDYRELFEKEKVLWAHEPYAVYRMYEDNKTGQDNAKRKKEIWRLQEELGDSKLNVAWCKHVYEAYEKAEEKGRPGKKKKIDRMSRILFHLSGRRIACF